MKNHIIVVFLFQFFCFQLASITNLKLKGVYAIEPPLVKKSLYLMLHKKHKKLIPEFNRLFSKMKKDGTINHLYNLLLKSL